MAGREGKGKGEVFGYVKVFLARIYPSHFGRLGIGVGLVLIFGKLIGASLRGMLYDVWLRVDL